MSREQIRDVALKPAAWMHSRLLPARQRPERGDMPGWILIVVITALIVFAIYSFLDNSLMEGFKQNINKVLNL